MKKETFEFLVGERGATLDQFLLSREIVANKEQLFISAVSGNYKTPIFRGSVDRLRVSPEELGEVAEIGKGKIKQHKPKHTGGKRPFIMVMQDKGDILEKLSLNASGLLLKLLGGGFIEWHTGRVIHRRSKKSMTVKMMCDKFNLKATDIKPILKELANSSVMKYDKGKRAYFIDRDIAKKGGGQGEDKV